MMEMGPLGLNEMVQGAVEVDPISARIEHEFVHRVEHESQLGETSHDRQQVPWGCFKGERIREIGRLESMKNSSILNVLLFCVPAAWMIYLVNKSHKIDPNIIFFLYFLSIVPLAKLFDFGGKQISFYTSKSIGDFLMVTLNKAIEATLTIILLLKCELRVLQATIVGVVLLRLLSGIGFLTRGTRIYQQALHQRYAQLNHTLLGFGMLSLMIPTAFFVALDATKSTSEDPDTVKQFKEMSRSIALILFSVYVVARIFLFNSPRNGDNGIPVATKVEKEDHLKDKAPKVNPWLCLFLIAMTVTADVTAKMLVTSVSKQLRNSGKITDEWFGLVLIPTVSFSGVAFIAIVYFLRRIFYLKPRSPETLTEDSTIDMSIQFTLFWLPLLVLIAWWMDKPLLLLCDVYEVVVLLGASFLVNYVIADQKTNWAEGYVMITFYFVITLCVWYFKGSSEIEELFSSCMKAYA